MNTTSAKSFIRVEDIKKTFVTSDGEIPILRGVSIEIFQGDFAIIFGPSGCGKSTLLHTLLGLEAPTSGKIYVEDKDFYIGNDDDRAQFRRHKVGMIYQQPLWIGSLNVMENLVFALHLLNYNSAVIEGKAKSVLEMTGMINHAYYRPMELSSGQQQKISLARALIIDPAIIVADEPTGNLDTVSGQELINTFLEVNKRGITIVMVTHDLEYLKYANRIFHMVDGQVVEDYRPKHRLMDGKNNTDNVMGKKTIGGTSESDVRDPEFLKKLGI